METALGVQNRPGDRGIRRGLLPMPPGKTRPRPKVKHPDIRSLPFGTAAGSPGGFFREIGADSGEAKVKHRISGA